MKLLKGLNDPILDLNNRQLEDIRTDEQGNITFREPITIKYQLSSVLGRAKSHDPIRAIDVAIKLKNANNKLELEDADVDMLKQAIEADQFSNNLAIAPCKKVLDGAEEIRIDA